MNERKGEKPNRERLIVAAISSLYTGVQTPDVQELVRKAKEHVEEDGCLLGIGMSYNDATGYYLFDILGISRNPTGGRETRIRALRHAKGVLVGQKKTAEREERLRIVSEELSKLSSVL